MLRPGTSSSLEEILTSLTKHTPSIDKGKSRKVQDILKILSVIGIVSSQGDQKLIYTAQESPNVSKALGLVVESSLKLKKTFASSLVRENQQELDKIEEIIERENPYKMTSEQIMSQRKKSSFDYTGFAERFMASNNVVLPTVKIRLRNNQNNQQ